MYPITNEVMALFEAEQRKVLRITGTDKNGATISITDNNVIADSFQVDRYSCNGEKLEVGTAIAAQMSLTLENGGGQYNGIVFEGAELFVEVGIADWTQSSPTITYVPCGYFTPDEQPRRLSTISITGLDRMTKFDVVVDAADLTFPTTVAGLVGQVCTLCSVTLAQSISGMVNAGVNVAELPTAQEEITYRNIIQWCAGVMGTNAWFDWNGQLRFSWYANATGYTSTVDNRYSSDLYEDDLTISGVEYTNDSGIVIVEGTDDYAIDLTGNAIAGPLVATVLPTLNTALNGFTYRPFTAAVINAPYLWPMDIVTFTDKDGNDHTSALTNVAFGLNGTTAMESKGMTYAINKLAQPKGFTREQAQLVNQAMEHVEQDIDESLTQQDIFDRLTDNGAAQGLVLYNGQLYVNASYIQAGTLTLGGLNNVNGQLRVLDASGNEVGKWTKDGIETIKGTLGEWTIDSHGLSKVSSSGPYDWDISITPNGVRYKSIHLPGIHDNVSQTLLDYSHIALSKKLGNLMWSNSEIYGEAENSTGASVLKLIASGQYYGDATDIQLTSKDHSDGGQLTVNAKLNVTGNTTFSGTVAASGGFVGNLTGNCSGTATKATQDGSGNTIASTYLKLSGGTSTGNIRIVADEPKYFMVQNTTTGPAVYLMSSNPHHGVYSNGYYDGSSFVSDEKWMIYRDKYGVVHLNGNASNVTGTVAVEHGGTGATSAANARKNLGIYSGRTSVSFSNGVGTIAFSTIGISSRPSVFVAMLNTTSSTGMHLAYDYNNSSSSIQLRLYSGTSLVSGNSGPYAVSWICIA